MIPITSGITAGADDPSEGKFQSPSSSTLRVKLPRGTSFQVFSVVETLPNDSSVVIIVELIKSDTVSRDGNPNALVELTSTLTTESMTAASSLLIVGDEVATSIMDVELGITSVKVAST